MGRPDDIPQDVWDAAENAFELMLCNDREASGSTEQFRLDSIEPHARAILAERERDAKIAESYAGHIRLGGVNAWHGASTIAAAIRKGGE